MNNEAFVLPFSKTLVKPKRELRIPIFLSEGTTMTPVYGKLTISYRQEIQWVYYLEGYKKDSA